MTFLEVTDSPENTRWYRFVYEDNDGIHSLEVDDDLNIRWEDGVLINAPYNKIQYYINPTKLSLLLYVSDPEDFFKGKAKVFVSEAQRIGLLNTQNYSYAKSLLGNRLIGGLNLIVSRDENGLTEVQACVVNEGVIPDF